MNILVDVDGVLLDMLKGIQKTLNKKNITFYPENVITYDFDGDIGCDKKYIFELFKDIDFYKNLDWFDNALIGLKELQKLGTTVSYTSVVSENILDLRQKFCDDYGLIGKVYFGKKPIVENADVVIEDCPENVELWLQHPTVKIFLINHTYNQNINHNRIIRVNNINDVVNYLLNEEN